jgi:BMFP domain-containing protein YqiC
LITAVTIFIVCLSCADIGKFPGHSSHGADARGPSFKHAVHPCEAAMIRPDHIEALSQRIGELLPPGLKEGAGDLRRNLRAAIGAQLNRLDLVNNDDYEVQREVLLHAREQLDQLRARVDALEAELSRLRGGD